MNFLFAPIAHWLSQFSGLPDIEGLNRLAGELKNRVSGSGAPIRFVPPAAAGAKPLPYELHIFQTGEVPTRPGSWHDAYNALCWLAFPRIKAALNARHAAHYQHGPRGPLRDAATQFDESGVVVMHADSKLARALENHAWEEVFWTCRAQIPSTLRFLVIGHALYEKLEAPYVGLCGKALYLEVPKALIEAPIESQVQHVDEALAAQFHEERFCTHPAALCPLPILGIPGVTPDNECREYYQDTRQFRPRSKR